MSIYLDYAADTPPDPRVAECYAQTALKCFANPNAAHGPGVAAKQTVDAALSGTASLLGVQPGELIYTSGASEANNLAVKGIAHANRRRGKHIVSTFLEHSSVSGALTFLQEQGWEISLVHLNPDGKIDRSHLRQMLREDTVLCAVCAVDSELGTVQPIREIADILRDAAPRCSLHVDATQAIGKIPFDFSYADSESEKTVLEPLIHGGASTTIYRSGTPDPAMAAACAKALNLCTAEADTRGEAVRTLNTMLRTKLSALPGVCINSPADAVPHILNLSVQGIKGEDMRRMLDERGICVSVKSACSVPNTPSRPVFAITRDRRRALSSWRISLSHLTTQEEADALIQAVTEIIRDTK